MFGPLIERVSFSSPELLKNHHPTTTTLINNLFFPPVSTSRGKVYVAQVKERAAARKMYDAAKKRGRAAGLVATKSDRVFSAVQMLLRALLCTEEDAL